MLKTGQTASLTRRFTPRDLADFERLGGRANGGIPAPLIGALVSTLLGTRVPGAGTNWLKQSLHLHAPAPEGATLVATVTVTRLRPDKRLVDLDCACRLADGTLIATGRALVAAGDVGGAWDQADSA